MTRRSLDDAYRAGEPAARALLGADWRARGARRRAVERAGVLDPAARGALTTQNPGRTEAVERLARGVAVVTGQQPGLFGGPLYGLLKAAHAVRMAAQIEDETGVPCVAVYWVQEEDHDFEEVRHHTVLAADDRLLRAELPGDDARVALAHRRLGEGSLEALASVERALEGTPHGAEVVALLRASYRPEESLPGAFATWLQRALDDPRLLTLQIRSPSLAEVLAPLHLRAFEEAERWTAALEARAALIEEAGFTVQVPVRPDTALSFVHPDGPEGPRFRANRDDGGWRFAGDGRRWSDATLRAQVTREPRSVSTSALLRPIAQDTLLPTVAYVAGPAELAYWAQLPALYEALGMAMPLVVPRVRGRWIPEEDEELLGAASENADPFQDDGPVARRLLGGLGELASLPERLEAEVERARESAERLDPNLARAVDKTRRTASAMAEKLVSKAARAALARDDAARGRLQALRARHRPAGGEQERVLGWPSIAARIGPASMRTQLERIDPVAAEPLVLR